MNSSIPSNKTLQYLLVFIALAAFYFSTQFATHRVIANDGHFHIRYSNLLLERGIPDKLPELRYTIWSQSYRDHHFLFHAFSIPFSLIPDIRVGAKVAAATFAVFAGLIFWWALMQLRVRLPWIWLMLFAAGSAGFLFRIQMPRVQSLALIVIIVTTVALIKKRNWLLFFIAFVNVWLYDSFILLGIVGLCWLASNRLVAGRWETKTFLWLVAGLIAGSVINPFFPHNYSSYLFSIKRSLAPMGSIPLPSEWQPQNAWQIILDNVPIVFMAVGLAIVGMSSIQKYQELKDGERSEHIFIVLLAIVFLALLFRSRRFIEYTAPIVILFLAVLHRDMLPSLSTSTRRFLVLCAGVIVIVGGAGNVFGFLKGTKTDETYHCYMHAGDWMRRNVKGGETIFITDWDDFPKLYMNAPHVRYVAGLDPLFMLRYDKDIYDTFCDVTLGKHKGPYVPIIKGQFDSKYVFTDTAHGPFIKKFDNEPGVYRVFGERTCRIYRIEDAFVR